MILEVKSIGGQLIIVGNRIWVNTKRLITCPLGLVPNTNIEMRAGAWANNFAHSVTAGQISIRVAFLTHNAGVRPLVVLKSVVGF